MNFEELYNKALSFWPETISISDGRLSNDSLMFENLNLVWDIVEAETQELGDWHQLMTWIIFTNFNKIAKLNYANKVFLVSRDQINKSDVRARLIENLKMEEYKDMYDEFLEDNLNV
ncbi:hypothetical protein [Sphingobacterium sp.]|uniref:hypothetical protein n=1 Tax=Sphingobacterium sp. TaxID=341027 RepID=UPI0025E6B1CF|nr:hypothetical protein [Sphingobacterium sp.]